MAKVSLLFLVFCIWSCQNPKEPKVTIAVAANMQHVMQTLIEEFELSYDIKVQTSSSSSGILTTQIRQGAPFDLFLSADMEHPRKLVEDGFAERPIVYAAGRLILLTYKKNINLDSGIYSLLHSNINKIAIANSEIAPYGRATVQAIERSGLLNLLNKKLIKGESINQVNHYIQSQNVDVGITGQSVIYSPLISDKGYSAELPDSLYTPINQGMVLLNHGSKENLSNSKEFYKFMTTSKAKEILTNYGYRISE